MGAIIIGITALIASLLTFFSGFGLGTILTPAFALFFPAEIAVAQTSIVHFINNIFKIFLIGKYINRKIIFMFGIPAILGAMGGAISLIYFSELSPVTSYIIGEKECIITPAKLLIGIMIITFSVLEIFPGFSKNISIKDNLIIGGLLSGFFGGLSGHQGALRSVFLIRFNLSKEEYIATGTGIAILIDLSRISLYINFFFLSNPSHDLSFMIIGTACAMGGALLGNFFLKKITLKFVQTITHLMLILIGLGMASGLI